MNGCHGTEICHDRKAVERSMRKSKKNNGTEDTYVQHAKPTGLTAPAAIFAILSTQRVHRRGVGRAMSNCNMHRTDVDHGRTFARNMESRSATRGPGVAWIDPNGKLMYSSQPYSTASAHVSRANHGAQLSLRSCHHQL
jgi:hypothetical protein